MKSNRKKDIRVTIQHLLALAHDPNNYEDEAQSALLKAQELMMKYNLDQVEIMSHDESHKDVERYMTDITFTKATEPWIADLAQLISQNTRCESFFTHHYGDKKRTIGFYGYSDDLQICVIMFNYALYCIWNKFPEIRSNMKNLYGYNIKQCRPYTDGYAVGFIVGMKDAFKKQMEDHAQKWALVAVTPQAVIDYANKRIKYVDLGSGPILDQDSYYNGVDDGKKWRPQKSIESKE